MVAELEPVKTMATVLKAGTEAMNLWKGGGEVSAGRVRRGAQRNSTFLTKGRLEFGDDIGTSDDSLAVLRSAVSCHRELGHRLHLCTEHSVDCSEREPRRSALFGLVEQERLRTLSRAEGSTDD